MSDPVTPFDLTRMFWGDAPTAFLWEILVRTLIVYSYTLALVRWVGGRGVAQLSLVEFLLVIALGSAVGDSLFYPDVPLLHALLTVTVIVVINKLLDMAIVRWRLAKRAIDGQPLELVANGVIDHGACTARELSSYEVMSMLRLHGIRNLGEVAHAYMESSGGLSVFRRDDPVAGLAIVPPLDLVAPTVIAPEAAAGAAVVCTTCGLVDRATQRVASHTCSGCGGHVFTRPARAAA